MHIRSAAAQTFSTEAVLERYRHYDLHRALALMHGRREAGCGLMRALCYHKLGLYERSIAACDEVISSTTDRYEKITTLMFRTLWLDGDERSAREALAQGLVLAEAVGDAQLPVFCHGQLIRLQTAVSPRSPDEAGLREALVYAKRHMARPRPWYVNEPEAVWTGAMLSLGLAYAAAGDVERDRETLLETLDIATKARTLHYQYLSGLVGNLAFFLRNWPSPQVRERIERVLPAIPEGTNDGLTERALRGLSVNAAVFGVAQDGLSPFRMRSAATIGERVMILADGLLLGGSRNEMEFRAAVAEARDLASRLDWFPNEEGSHDPVLLAAALAPHDVEVAELRTYVPFGETLLDREETNIQSRHRSPLHDLRRGLIEKARGNVVQARASLQAALAHARTYGLLPLAAVAGIERFTLSRDPGDLRDAERLVEGWGRSWMGRRLRAAFARLAESDPGDFPYLRHGC